MRVTLFILWSVHKVVVEESDGCSYEFDPVAWEATHGFCAVDEDDEILTDTADGRAVWQCPHEAHTIFDNEPRCQFHLPTSADEKPDSDMISDEFIQIVNGHKLALDSCVSRPAQFIGATFESLAVNVDQIGDGRKLDLRHAEIGFADLSKTTINVEEFNAQGVYIKGEWNCTNAVFSESVGFAHAKFGEDARFSYAEFCRGAGFHRAEFCGEARFSHAEFSGFTLFEGAKFGGTAHFQRAEFGWNAWFHMVEFGGSALFPEAKFCGNTSFVPVKFGGTALFTEATFAAGAEFVAEGENPVSLFQDRADFSNIVADGPMQFSDNYTTESELPYTFRATVDFSGADIPNAEFSDVSFSKPPIFDDADLMGADMSGLSLDQASFEDANLIRTDLSESSITEGRFNGAVLERAGLYGTDFRNAKLYGVRLAGAHVSDHTDFGIREMPDSDRRTSIIPLRGPFPAVRYDPRNPEYHQYAGDDRHGGESISDHTRAASVYAEVQRVAQTNAASDLASRCFRWRKDMQRKRYASDDGRGNTRNRLRRVWAEMSNGVARYGDSPRRVVITSIVTIILFGVLYPFFGGMQLTGEEGQVIAFDTVLTLPELPTWMDILLSNLYFSAVTFTTLGYGDIRPSGPVSQALASIESFLGAALLALLVAVLARRITR